MLWTLTQACLISLTDCSLCDLSIFCPLWPLLPREPLRRNQRGGSRIAARQNTPSESTLRLRRILRAQSAHLLLRQSGLCGLLFPVFYLLASDEMSSAGSTLMPGPCVEEM